MNKTFLILLLFSLDVRAQSDYIKMFQGKWYGIVSSEPDSRMNYWNVIKGNQQLCLSYDSISLIDVNIRTIGFLDRNSELEDVSELKSQGEYLYFCSTSENNKLNCFVITSFSIEDTSYYFGKTSIFEFYKTEDFPNSIYQALFIWDKKHATSYSKEFLNCTVGYIKEPKTFIYASPDKVTKRYIIKNDPVEILLKQGDWYKIQYYGKQKIQGWIRSTAIE